MLCKRCTQYASRSSHSTENLKLYLRKPYVCLSLKGFLVCVCVCVSFSVLHIGLSLSVLSLKGFLVCVCVCVCVSFSVLHIGLSLVPESFTMRMDEMMGAKVVPHHT